MTSNEVKRIKKDQKGSKRIVLCTALRRTTAKKVDIFTTCSWTHSSRPKLKHCLCWVVETIRDFCSSANNSTKLTNVYALQS